MSDLTRFRDHCRHMATELDKARPHLRLVEAADARSKRDLWLMLADEIDAYTARDPDVVDRVVADDPPMLFEAPRYEPLPDPVIPST